LIEIEISSSTNATIRIIDIRKAAAQLGGVAQERSEERSQREAETSWEPRVWWVIVSKNGYVMYNRRGPDAISSGRYSLFTGRGDLKPKTSGTVRHLAQHFGIGDLIDDAPSLTLYKIGDPNYRGKEGLDDRGIYRYRSKKPSQHRVTIQVVYVDDEISISIKRYNSTFKNCDNTFTKIILFIQVHHLPGHVVYCHIS